jgi:hypothetical protein
MKNKNERDPIAAFQRRSTSSRRFGQGKKCKCGEDRPLALVSGSDPTICASCQREKNGQSPFDSHHPAGRANHPATIPVWVNDHRARLSDDQYDWPDETWRNPSGSPILASAASIRGYCETNDYLVGELLIRNAKMLERLDRYLTKRLGPDWWRETEIEEFAPKRTPGRQVIHAK